MFFFFHAEDGIRSSPECLEFRRVLFRSINSPKRLRLKSKGNKNKTMENIEKKMYTQRTSREKFPAERFTKNSVENITSEHVKISSIFSKVFKSNASKPIGKFSNEYFKEEQKGTKERILSGKKINRENSSNSYKGNIDLPLINTGISSRSFSLYENSLESTILPV